MIHIDRARTPETILEMAEHLTIHAPDTREGFVRDYLELYRRNPDALFVLEARVETELAGFLIATVEPTHVYLTQIWAKPGTSRRVMDSMLQRMYLWAASIDRYEVRGETRRDVAAMFRRFGFEETSINLKYQIPDTILDRFLETTNGR